MVCTDSVEDEQRAVQKFAQFVLAVAVVRAQIAEPLSDAREVYMALVTGLRDYVHKNGFRSVVLGMSGGIDSARRIVAFGFVEAPRRVKELLGPGQVLEVRRVHLADGEPFARVTVWCPEQLGAELSRADVERASFLEQLPVELGGATQTIGAATVSASDAELLELPAGVPVLVGERITRDRSGRPVLVSEHVFPAHRTQFVVELAADEQASLLPEGLRLLE